jgi:MFS family permease
MPVTGFLARNNLVQLRSLNAKAEFAYYRFSHGFDVPTSAERSGANLVPSSTDKIIHWRGVSAGLCANLVGIGLARFAYPLIPALIAAHWFSPSAAVYLGAANLAGYLAGALIARPIATQTGAAPPLRAMMLTAAGSFCACAFPLSFGWFFLWRFASGISGGVLMALAAPAVLPHVSPSRRGLAGAIFTGVGLGIAASGPWCRC